MYESFSIKATPSAGGTTSCCVNRRISSEPLLVYAGGHDMEWVSEEEERGRYELSAKVLKQLEGSVSVFLVSQISYY